MAARRQTSGSIRGSSSSLLRNLVALVLFIALVILGAWARGNRYSSPPKFTLKTLESFGGIGTDLQPDTGVPLGFTRFELDREQADEFDGLVCTSHDIDQGPNRFLTVSEQAVAHLADGQRVFPVGTVLYKAYHSKAGGRMVFAVMRKREAGFDPEHHDWAYLYGESYQPYEIGRVERCAACHSRAASQDYVFSRAP